MEHHYMIPWTSDGKVDFNSHTVVEAYKMNSPLVKLHGKYQGLPGFSSTQFRSKMANGFTPVLDTCHLMRENIKTVMGHNKSGL